MIGLFNEYFSPFYWIPIEKVEDVADEYDSNVSTTDSEADSDDSAAREKKKKKKEKKEKKKTHREKSTSSSVSFKPKQNT